MNKESVRDLAQSLVARPINPKLQTGFTSDATYSSVFVKTTGAHNIERIYQLYALVEPAAPKVGNVEYNDEALTATISFSTPVSFPFGWFKDRVSIPTTSMLHFKRGGQNNKLVIDKQVDIAPWGIDKKLLSLPVVGSMWKNFVLPAVSFMILQVAIFVLALRSGADLRQEKDLKYNNEIAMTVDTALPYLKQGYSTASPYIQQGLQKAQQAQAKAAETAQLAHIKAHETAQFAQAKAQETAQFAQAKAQPFIAKAQPYLENVQPYIKSATEHAQHAQELAMDALSRVPVVNDVLAKQGLGPNSKSGANANAHSNANGATRISMTIGSINEPVPAGSEKNLARHETHSIRTSAEVAMNPRAHGSTSISTRTAPMPQSSAKDAAARKDAPSSHTDKYHQRGQEYATAAAY